MNNEVLVKALVILAGTIAAVGCRKNTQQSQPERLSDIVPLKVVVTDFVHSNEKGISGANVIYRIRGSACIAVPIGLASITRVDSSRPNIIDITKIPCPRVDPRSVRFEENGTELLDCGRGIFTSIGKTGELHNRLRKDAARAIENAANNDDVINEAKQYFSLVLRGFYAATGVTLNNCEWDDGNKRIRKTERIPKMKHIIPILFFIGLMLCGCSRVEEHTVNISVLQKLSRLNVLYVTIAEPLTLKSPTGKTWVKFLVCGGAFYYIDLEKSTAKRGETLELTLGKPKIYPCADMQRSEEYDQHTDLFITDKVLNELRESFPDEANKLVAKAARRDEFMTMAMEQAEVVLRTMLPKENLVIIWQ